MTDSSPEEGRNEDRLGQRFLVGSFYLGALGWVTSVVNFAANLLLARLLGPDAFGLYALVAAVNAVIGMVGAFSIGLAVIQSREESQELYDTGVFISVVSSIVALAIALSIAPFLAARQGDAAAWFLVVLSLGRILMLTGQVLVARIERMLRYRAIAVIQLLGGNIPSIIAVGLAALGFGAWSLVARDFLVAATIFFCAWVVSGYRYRNQVTRNSISSIMAFARPMFVARSLEIGVERVDRLIVGAFLGDKTLGFYHQARLLSETGIVATRPLGRLSFNLYSRLQDQPERLARSYRIVNFFLVRIVFAGSSTLMIFPAETIRLLLGEAWLDAAPVLRLLGLYGGLLPVFENMKQLLYGRGRMRENVVLRSVQVTLLAAGAGVGALLGNIEIVAATLLAVPIAGIVIADRVNRDVVGSLARDLFLVPSLCLSFSAAVLAVGGDQVRVWSLPYWILPLLPPLVYGAALFAVEHRRIWRELDYLRGVLRPSV